MHALAIDNIMIMKCKKNHGMLCAHLLSPTLPHQLKIASAGPVNYDIVVLVAGLSTFMSHHAYYICGAKIHCD